MQQKLDINFNLTKLTFLLLSLTTVEKNIELNLQWKDEGLTWITLTLPDLKFFARRLESCILCLHPKSDFKHTFSPLTPKRSLFSVLVIH